MPSSYNDRYPSRSPAFQHASATDRACCGPGMIPPLIPAGRSPRHLLADVVVRRKDDRLVRLEARLLDERHQLLAEGLELLGRFPDVQNAQTAGYRADDVGQAAAARPVGQRAHQLPVVQPSADLVVLLRGPAGKVEDHTDSHDSPPGSAIRRQTLPSARS